MATSSSNTTTFPLWIVRTPEMSANNVDLPTPSGPITPTILRAGISIVTSSSATVAPYRCETPSSRATDLRPSLRQLDLQVFRPRGRHVSAHDSEPAHARFHPPAIFFENLRIQLELGAEHQFFAFLLGFDGLRRELRIGGDKTDLGRNHVLRDRVENDAGLAANFSCRQRPPARRWSYKRRAGRGWS